MSLRNALLGLLAERPMSGYDLTKLFDRSLANVWSARHSQIYPELARLQQQGLIREHEKGPRGRKTYALADAGLVEVRRWLTETEPDPVKRDEAYLRVFFLWLLDPSEAEAYLRKRGEAHRAKLREYETISAAGPPRTAAEKSFRLALEAGMRHERALLEWAEWAANQVRTTERKRAHKGRRVDAVPAL